MSMESPDFDLMKEAAEIPGNANGETKQIVARWLHLFVSRGTGFGDLVGQRVKLTEIAVNTMPNEDTRMEGRVIAEITVAEDMTNGSGNIHGGCTMYLIDVLSRLPLCALDCAQGGAGNAGLSQAVHTIFHAPAPCGADLKVVSTSLSIGGRTMSCRCEIWDTTNHRLVATGTQVTMLPSRM